MRAYDHVHLPGAETLDDPFLLRPALEAAEHGYVHRICGKSLGKGCEMLLREHGGRHQHGDLLAVVDHFEGGAYCHLGLAVSNVAADQAVHRFRRFEVLLHVLDGFGLVRCLLVPEG